MRCCKYFLMLFAVAMLFCGFAVEASAIEWKSMTPASNYGVFTIYNRTGVKINYQIRVMKLGGWSEWENTSCSARKGYVHWFQNITKAEVKFDRIAGDDEYTEKSYNVKFNGYPAPMKDGTFQGGHGKPYHFSFDRGGMLLDFYNGCH